MCSQRTDRDPNGARTPEETQYMGHRGSCERPETAADGATTAAAAHLRYVSDAEPGIRRRRSGSSFRYVDSDGKPMRDAETLARIRGLVIPPAWDDVWICSRADGHLQATGRDARGRKQYRYHVRWREVRDEAKFDRLAEFGKALPRLRRQIAADMRKHGLPREKVLAAVVKLLETTLIRVGNDEYARDNGSFGLTTLRTRHAAVSSTHVSLTFVGKSGKRHQVDVSDRSLARIIQRCHDIPGQQLFQYIDGDGARQHVTSADVNDYIREGTGGDFTAKDFRTWSATVLAYGLLSECEGPQSEREAQHHVVDAVAQVAEELRNTPAVCRKCYIHPLVLERHEPGLALRGKVRKVRGLSRDESAVLELLEP